MMNYNRIGAKFAAVLALIGAVIAACGWLLSNPAPRQEDTMRNNGMSNGRFLNAEPTTVTVPGKFWDTTYQFLFRGSKDRVPHGPLPVVSMEGYAATAPAEGLRFIWLGHSTVLVELHGKRLLFDPMFSERASFLPWLGPKRFQPPPISVHDLPSLDAVLISHDHYDHLDRESVIELIGKSRMFFVPLGVGAILEQWGVPHSKVQELGWWDEQTLDNMTIAALPARHFSGRGLFDRDRTLWCSWALIDQRGKVFFSGDTGMTSAFREIGKRYGPFDITFIKIAAYNVNWPDIHLTPEQAVQVHRDVGGRSLVPIHWAVFDLGLHSWYEPIERLTAEADTNKVRLLTPRMGERVDPLTHGNAAWWREFME